MVLESSVPLLQQEEFRAGEWVHGTQQKQKRHWENTGTKTEGDRGGNWFGRVKCRREEIKLLFLFSLCTKSIFIDL